MDVTVLVWVEIKVKMFFNKTIRLKRKKATIFVKLILTKKRGMVDQRTFFV